MIDERKRPSVNIEFIQDGYYKSYSDNLQVPHYYYLGPNAEVKKITEYELSNDLDTILSDIDGLIGTSVKSNTKSLIGVSGPNEILYIDNTPYYAYSKEYIELPNHISVPLEKKINKRTQINSSGYTLNGDPIIVGGSKGLIITESFIGEDKNLPTQGKIDSQTGYFVSSISKNNKRYINDLVYYDITITYQEL